MKLFKRGKDKEDDDVQLILRRGIDFDLRGEHEKALSCYDKALKIDPNSIYVLINKGTALDYLGRYTEALHYYDRALELAPENIDALLNKAVTLYNNRQRNDEVLAICNQALQIQPYNATLLYMKGIVLKFMGMVSEAKAYLDKASELDPKFDSSLNDFQPMNRALSEKPISYYDKALEIDPNNEDALADKSLALANMGKHKEAGLLEAYFVEEELKGNWRTIVPTDQQSSSSTNQQQPKSHNWHIYNALDNTSCEIHMLTHDESRTTLKFKKDANVLVTPTRLRFNGEDLMEEQRQPLS